MLCHTAIAASLIPRADGWRPTSVGYIDSEVLPIRCNYDSKSHADQCEIILEAAELAWQVQVDEIGFAEPMPDSDGILDFYIDDITTKGGGYTYGPYEDEDSTDGRMGGHAYVALSSTISDFIMPSYVYHEFNHVLQFAMDFTEPSLPMWEANAQCAQKWTDASESAGGDEVQDFQATPWAGLLSDGYQLWADYSLWSYYEYGAAIWILHLDHYWGDDQGAAGANLWWAAGQQGWANEPDVIDAYDEVTGGWVAALADLSIERTLMGSSATPIWADDYANSRFAVFIEAELNADDLPTTVTPEFPPYQTGVSYVSVENVEPGQVVTFEATSGSETWAVFVRDGDTSDWADGSTISWTAQSSSLVLGAINLGDSDWDADDRLTSADDAEFSVSIEEGGGDTQGPDTGSADTGEANGGHEGRPNGNTEDDKKGCACASAPAVTPWYSLFGLLFWFGRRRRSE